MNRDTIIVIIFSAMSIALLYLMNDNRKLEMKLRATMRVAVRERHKRKCIEMCCFGREVNDDFFEEDDFTDELNKNTIDK